VACCRRSTEAGPTDLYPDPDAGPLQAALSELGARSTLVAWDDPAAEWGSFSDIVVSSTWDSVDRPVEYLAWAHRVAAQSVLVNPAPVIEWCLDKVHQRRLAAAGVPMVPTTWVTPEDNLPRCLRPSWWSSRRSLRAVGARRATPPVTRCSWPRPGAPTTRANRNGPGVPIKDRR